MPNHIKKLIQKRFEKSIVLNTFNHELCEHIVVKKQSLLDLCSFLHRDPDCAQDLLIDLFAVCHQQQASSFHVFYSFVSTKLKYKLLLQIDIDEEDLSIPSIHSLYKNASWLEREIWDMFGIDIEGHPNLRRILTYHGFAGHPLKKEYPLSKQQPLVPIAYNRGIRSG